MLKPLTARQAGFVSAYLRGQSAAAAAREAGYSETHAAKASDRILTNPAVAAAVEAGRNELQKATQYELQEAVAEVDATMEFAKKHKNPMALFKCVEMKAKLHGLLAEEIHLKAAFIDLRAALTPRQARLLGMPVYVENPLQ